MISLILASSNHSTGRQRVPLVPSSSDDLNSLCFISFVPTPSTRYPKSESNLRTERVRQQCRNSGRLVFHRTFPLHSFTLSSLNSAQTLPFSRPFDSLTGAQEGASWNPNDLLQTTFTPPSSESFDHSPSSLSTPSFSRNSRTNDRHTPPGWQSVPARLLLPGTSVLITLKQDQGTDRTVQGVVGEKLTRGDHPRGVKVRLRDGRVGRVVRILSGEEAGNTGRTG